MFLKNSDSGFQTEPVDVRGPSAPTFPRLTPKNTNIREVKRFYWSKKRSRMGKRRPFTSNHLKSPPEVDFLSPDARSNPRSRFARAITPLADRRASAHINVISQRAERTGAPSRARRHIAHVLPSRLCHRADHARQGGASASRAGLSPSDDLKKRMRANALMLSRP